MVNFPSSALLCIVRRSQPGQVEEFLTNGVKALDALLRSFEEGISNVSLGRVFHLLLVRSSRMKHAILDALYLKEPQPGPSTRAVRLCACSMSNPSEISLEKWLSCETGQHPDSATLPRLGLGAKASLFSFFRAARAPSTGTPPGKKATLPFICFQRLVISIPAQILWRAETFWARIDIHQGAGRLKRSFACCPHSSFAV